MRFANFLVTMFIWAYFSPVSHEFIFGFDRILKRIWLNVVRNRICFLWYTFVSQMSNDVNIWYTMSHHYFFAHHQWFERCWCLYVWIEEEKNHCLSRKSVAHLSASFSSSLRETPCRTLSLYLCLYFHCISALISVEITYAIQVIAIFDATYFVVRQIVNSNWIAQIIASVESIWKISCCAMHSNCVDWTNRINFDFRIFQSSECACCCTVINKQHNIKYWYHLVRKYARLMIDNCFRCFIQFQLKLSKQSHWSFKRSRFIDWLGSKMEILLWLLWTFRTFIDDKINICIHQKQYNHRFIIIFSLYIAKNWHRYENTTTIKLSNCL